MITVTNNDEKYKFDSIEEYYRWICSNKNINKFEVSGSKEAIDLYEFFKFYFNIKKKFEENIDNINNSFVDESDNKFVLEAIEELIRMNSDGKYLRAALIALGYISNNGEDDKFLPLSLAYETFQTSILIHDDIIDNADLRRGKITIPKSYEKRFDIYDKKKEGFEARKKHIADSLGVCIGDLGFYFASKIVINNYYDDKNFKRILDLYNKIVTNTIKGEIIDVLLPFEEQYNNDNITKEDSIMEIYRLKTAWYSIIGPFALGMVLSDVEDEKVCEMEDVLYNLGIAFQIKDDILGIYGNESEIGKSASSDISEFKQTILYSYVANKNPKLLIELDKYYGKENLSSEDINAVKDIFYKSGAKEYSISMMESMFEKSRDKLSKIDFIDEKYKNILNGFITYLNLRTK